MALTLQKNADGTISAASGKKFTVEVRTKGDGAAIVSSTYNSVTHPGPRPTHTATNNTRTLAVVYEANIAEGSRVELWEVAGDEEQLLRYRYHHPGRSFFGVQIN